MPLPGAFSLCPACTSCPLAVSLLSGALDDVFAWVPIPVSLPALDEASLCSWIFTVLTQVRIAVHLLLTTALH